MKKSSFSNLLIRRNISLIFLCLMIAICIVCMVNINTLHSERVENAKHLLSTHQTSADWSIRLVSSIVYQTTRESFFNEYLLSDNDINYSMLQILNSLNLRLSTIDNFCYSVGILKEDSSFVLSNRQSASLDIYLDCIQLSQSAYDQFASSIPYSVNGTYFFLDDLNAASPYLTMGTKFSYHGNSTLCILISYYKEYFTAPFEDPDRFMILSENRILLDSKDSPFDSCAGNALRMVEGYNALNGNLITMQTGHMMYTAIPSSSFNCWYVLVEPIPLFWTISNVLLSIFILCLSAAIILVLKTTRRLVKPIDTTLDTFRPFSGDEVRSHNDISYLSSTAEQIIQENKTLSSKLNRRIRTLKTYFITDILLGILPADEIDPGLAEYDLTPFGESATVVILDVCHYDPAADLETIDLKTILPSILAAVNSNEVTCDYVPFRSKYVILFNTPDYDKICKMVKRILALLEEECCLSLMAAIGIPADTPYKWKDSFNTALNLLEHKYALPQKKILAPEHLTLIADNSFYYPLDIEALLINHTILQERSRVHMIISEILSKNFHPENAAGQILELKQAMVCTINRCLQRINATVSDVFDEGVIFYLELKMCENEEALKKTLWNLFDGIMDYISLCTSKRCKLTAQSFEDYIAQSFYRDISLTEVAEYFELSVPYTSKIIKQVTGQTFKEYLNKYRVQKAKTLFLQNKDLKIQQVAQKVGFTNTNTFLRVFKSIEGMSPGEFRREQL